MKAFRLTRSTSARAFRFSMRLAGAGALVVASQGIALADKIKNGTAVFSGLDKITGRIISFEAAMDETVQFGSLKVTARACYTRPATEAPQTTTFTEVDEASAGNEDKRIFSGWMYASSPGLHGIEHPIYDVWLTACKKPGETIVDAPQVADAEQPPPAAETPPKGADAAVKPPAAVIKPRRVVRTAPPPVRPVAVQQQEPTQKFFPAFQYPTDLPARDPAGSKR